MEIKRGNTVLADVYLKDNSYVEEEVMSTHTLTLNFLSRNVVDLQINDYVVFDGNTYKIRHNEKVTKRETSLGYEYNVTFYSSRYDLQDVEFFLHGKPERKKNFDYYTGTARQWLDLMVKNMNRTGSGWVAGSCIESRMITLSFKDKKVGNVMDEVVKELKTEYWISGKTMSIGKREYASNGLILGQGEGMGFTELEVSAVDDTPPITVLYPYGSDKNLSTDYGSDYLLLPGGKLSIEKNVDKYGRIEKSVPFDHIFPQGEFTVTEKIDTTILKASDIDFNLKDCLIDDVEVIATFQDGGLAGYDLAIVKESVDDAKKQFKLKVNKEENALTVPGDINFSVGDKFILTGLKMPQSYINNASNQLLEEATAYLDEHCEKRVQLRGKCDEVIFRNQNIFVSCGQMVGVYSEQLNIDREIRVTRVKRYIENGKPSYRYELTLSDFLQGNGFKDLVDDVEKLPGEIEDKVKPLREHTKRSLRDVMETLGMMFDPEGDYFTELIKPLAVHTAQLIVGTNSQQMDLIGIKFSPNADNDPNYFKSTAGKLVHFTVRETIAEWTIASSAHRLNNALPYYVYAKCSKTTSTGNILATERKIKLEEEAGYYHFWVGVLNTPEGGVRSWNPNYGFTEIAGQTITTGVIKDKLARLVIDLVNAKITALNGATIEGKIKFTAGSSGLRDLAEWTGVEYDIDSAKSEAESAKTKADNAALVAQNATSRLNGWASDSYISPAEKTALKQQGNEIRTEYQEIAGQVSRYYLSNTSAWNSYYSVYLSTIVALDKYTASSPENIVVESDYGNIAAYYPYRKSILDAIAAASKKYVDDAIINIGNPAAGLKELEYLKTAIANETLNIGGLLLTSLLKLGIKNGSTWQEKAGINGTARYNNDVIAWFGGTLNQAISDIAAIVFHLDGSGQLAKGNIKWNADGSGQLANGNIRWDTNGSGQLANGNITWGASGDATFKGKVSTTDYGSRIVLNPAQNRIELYTDSRLAGYIDFTTDDFKGITPRFTSTYSDGLGTSYTGGGMFSSLNNAKYALNGKEGLHVGFQSWSTSPTNAHFSAKWRYVGSSPRMVLHLHQPPRSADNLISGDIYVDSNNNLKWVP